MKTECNTSSIEFQSLNRRNVVGQFDGGAISSDAGALLLREVEQRVKIIHQFAKCFSDYRSEILTEHSVEELVAQRIYALTLGYEDINDHDELRHDPLLALLMKTSTTMMNSATIRFWRSWWASTIPKARPGCACVIGAKPWQARAL